MKKIDLNQLTKTDNLLKFLAQNQGVDFLTYNFQDQESLIKLNFKNLKRKVEELSFQIKAFQRLIRIVPSNDSEIALALMRKGVHSALQIAAMTRRDFMANCKHTLDSELADTIYQNALAKRSQILVQHMNKLQNNEPHIVSAKFN